MGLTHCEGEPIVRLLLRCRCALGVLQAELGLPYLGLRILGLAILGLRILEV